MGWHDAKGRLNVSSARVALRRLEKHGPGAVAPDGPPNQGALPRGLSDDGQPLPVLPHFTAGGRALTGLQLRLMQDEHDPAHPIWNRLIVREHPLGRPRWWERNCVIWSSVTKASWGPLGLGPRPITWNAGISGLAGRPWLASKTGPG